MYIYVYIFTYGFVSKFLFPKSAIIRVYMGLRFLLISYRTPPCNEKFNLVVNFD